jgi:SAM-dependent methyltransferase
MIDPVESQDAWLSVGAPDKASSVERLTGDLSIRSVLEIGCGSGALLAEMIDRKIGSEYAACEPSRELFALARSRAYETEVDVRCETFERSGFDERSWDLVVLSHVLEHTHDPAALVVRVLAVARYVVIEVPLEGTRMGAVRSLLRRAVTGRRRTDNAAGHIQFFSVADIRRLVHWSGGDVVRSRTYFPLSTYRYMKSDATGWRRLYYNAWLFAHSALGSRLLARVYYGHFAALAVPRSVDDESVVPFPLYWHPGKS